MSQSNRVPSRLAFPIAVPLAVLWALAGVGAVLTHSAADWQSTVGILMVSQAFCGALAMRRFRLIRSAVLPDFLTVFLFVQFVNNTLTAAGQILSANREASGIVAQYLSSESVPPEYMFHAELVFLIGTVVFAVAWRLLEGRVPMALWREPAPGPMWSTYGFALGIHLLLTSTPRGVSLGMTQEMMKWFSLGALAMLLGGGSEYGLGRRKSWLPILALLPLYVLALRSGMKSEVALVSLPVLLPVVRRLDLRRSLILAGFAVVVVMFVFPFSQAWRVANWSGAGNASIGEVASEVLARWREDGLLETAADGASHWLARSSSAEAGGLVMQLAERDGRLGTAPLQGLATIFVPRFLWADKPQYAPGAWFTWYLGKAPSPEEATSATAMMLAAEMYWMLGFYGVIGGMLLLSALHFHVWRHLVRRSAGGLVPMVALFALLTTAPTLQENFVIYAFSSPLILVVYVAGLDYLQRLHGSMLSMSVGARRRVS